MTAVQRVIVVGHDAHAWLAAVSLKRAFHGRDLDVSLLELAGSVDAPVARWTLPSLRATHSLLGIKESDFVRRTGATFKLGTEHSAWQIETRRYLHAHGEIGSEIQGVPFYKYLLLQGTLGRQESHELYSLAAVAARNGRFARPMSQSALTSSFTYAFHVDESSYTAYLREHADKLGVRRVSGRLETVSIAESGEIDALVLENGQRLEADFYIDCSGRAALLMSRVSGHEREDWSGWLPNDRMLSAPKFPPPHGGGGSGWGHTPGIENPRAMTETIAQEVGWRWRVPLAQSSAVGFVYSSALLSDDAAADRLRTGWGHSLRGHSSSSRSVPIEPADDDMVCSRISQGRRKFLWDHNCLALGEAAIEIEPLAGANLHLTQLGIATFIEMFPIASDTRLERIEYNRAVGQYADSLRDFTIAHYRTNTRSEEYWIAARTAPPPSRLQEKMDLYAATGRIDLLDNEVFDELDWAWLLLGSGYFPERIAVHTRSALARVRTEDLATLRESISRLAATMPRYVDFVRQHAPTLTLPRGAGEGT